MKDTPAHHTLLPHLFRQEYARMTTVLCRHFGLKHIETAEDIASDTFLKASEHWALQGVPENPVAWLYTVAKNKTRDYLRREVLFDSEIRQVLSASETAGETDFEYNDRYLTDSQLAMIFAVCNPACSAESAICLALQILCGFSVNEIADAFLSPAETIKKRLHRARARLRDDNFRISELSEADIRARTATVLKTLYLLFNEGYFSRSGNQQVRKHLCAEAVRLALLLTENPLTCTPEVYALLALMCYQSSRLEARVAPDGGAILFNEQDKNLWDQSLIDKGHYYLVNACTGNEASKYHLEAAVAYWHTTPEAADKWQSILQLYNQLVVIEHSPAAALNRVFAFAHVYGPEAAIREAEKLHLKGNSSYYALLGYLYARIDASKAADYYRLAIDHAASVLEKQTLKKEMERLKEEQPEK